MAGDIVVNREKKPILTKESLANTDLVLYQLSTILPVPPSGRWYNYWFPRTYVYYSGLQLIWQKLKSKKYCEKIAPLFGVSTASEIAEMVKESKADPKMSYSGCFECAIGVLNSIKLEDIGTLD